MIRLLLTTLAALLLAACSPLGLLNSVIPEAGMARERGIAYGSDARNTLDVYRPAAPSASPRTVVVFFYGGAWQTGAKEEYLFAAEALVSKGYVVVVPDYRVFPQVTFPAFMDDAAAALRWTLAHAARHGGDPDRVFVMGHSAGAQIAALLAYDRRYLGADAARIRGLVSLAGPMDFLPLTEPELFSVFPEAVRADSQPIRHVSGREPPTLLLHGQDDKRVGLHNAINLAARLRDAGSTVETTYYPDMGHPGILAAIAAPFRARHTVLERVAGFIERHAAGPRGKVAA